MGKNGCADHEVAERYISKFAKLISNGNLKADRNYNANERLLSWCYVPGKTLATAEVTLLIGIKDAKERLTVLIAANVARMHLCKLLVFG